MSAGIEKKKFSSNKISSLHFMAPERLMGELDFTQIQQMGKADTWAIGVILYFLLLGNLPFVGSNVSKLVKTVKKGKLKKVDQKEWCSDLKSLWDLITKLILSDPR